MRRDELIGTTIANRFRVKRILGEGGMATVFVAEQDAEPREVALKVLRPELTADKSFAKRFEREAKAAARVQHPSSVKILDAGVAGGLSYIAMELLRGDDLYTLLERHRALSARTAATIVAEVCEALAVAHGLGIVHRDLKPENIMIVRDPSIAEEGGPESVPLPAGSRVKVLDFGIAKLLDTQPEAPRRPGDRLDPPSAMTAVTRVGTLIGTPAYMSPEQCAQLPLDARSDVYTCGVLLFQMITGRVPFEGPTPLHVATMHIHEEPPAPGSLVPGLHAELEAVILKALAKKPADRQPSARSLGAALKKLLPALPDRPYRGAGRTTEDGLSISEASTDPLSIDVSVASLDRPDGMASAKTMVAEGAASGPPPSVVVHEPAPAAAAPPRRPLMILARHAPGSPSNEAATAEPITSPSPEPPAPQVEAEPEDLASTLVRATPGERESSPGAKPGPIGGAGGRQVTMQSAAPAGSAAPVERAARIAIVQPQAPAPAATTSPVPGMPVAPPIGAVMVPVHHAPPPVPSASVILSPGLVPAAAPGPAGVAGVVPGPAPLPAAPPAAPLAAPEPRSIVAAPTFGLPPAAGPAPVPAPVPVPVPAPAPGRGLWIGILIGTIASAVLFTLAYVLFLSR